MKKLILIVGLLMSSSVYAEEDSANTFRKYVKGSYLAFDCQKIGFELADNFIDTIVKQQMALVNEGKLSEAESKAIIAEERTTYNAERSLDSYSVEMEKKDPTLAYKRVMVLYYDKREKCISLNNSELFHGLVKPGAFVTSGAPSTLIDHLEFKAKQGDMEAADMAAGFYIGGFLGQADNAKGFYWTEYAAARGYAEAQHRLANLYKIGMGVKSDPVSALAWILVADSNGWQDASKEISEYQKGLSRIQREEAEQRAKAWKPVTDKTVSQSDQVKP